MLVNLHVLAENMFTCIGQDWLVVLSNSIIEEMKTKVFIVLWRSWHLTNDAIQKKKLQQLIQCRF
jgi:hypothetical protein